MSELTPHAAEIRLAQYGERGKPYECGNEKALYEIALTLKAEVDRLRSELRITTGHRDYWHAETMCATDRIVELGQARMASPAAAPVPVKPAGETGEAVEYGLRVTDGGRTAVRFTGPDRGFLAANLNRYRFQYPDAVLVQRTVRYGTWTEVTS